MEVKQDRSEEKYNKDGKMVSYQPPVYHYEYDYTMRIKVRTPWFDDMDFKLNNISLEEKDRHEIMEIEQTGNQIVAALTGNVAMNSGMSNMNGGMQYGNMGMNNGIQNMNGGMQHGNMGMNNGMQNMNSGMQYSNMGMNNGMQNMNGGMQYGNMGMNNGMQNMNGGMQQGNMGMNNGMQNMNGGMQQENMGMNQNMNGNAQQMGGTWKCQCGADNTGKFCEFCGQPRPF